MIHFLEERDEASKKLDEQLKGEEEITSDIIHLIHILHLEAHLPSAILHQPSLTINS